MMSYISTKHNQNMIYIIVCPKCKKDSKFNENPVSTYASNTEITTDGTCVSIKCEKCGETSLHPIK